MTTLTQAEQDAASEAERQALRAERAEGLSKNMLAKHNALERQKEASIARQNGIDVGNGEYLHLQLILFSSKRGIIRERELDYKKKLKQWRRADAAREDL